MKPTAEQMASMLKDYFDDPNCWPHLWIQGEGLDDDSQKLFCELASKIKDNLQVKYVN